MELIENYCLICKKYTSVLSNRDSNLYFRLLHKYLYAENLSDIEFKQIYIEKQLCTQCAFKIESVSTFINNTIIKDFHPMLSDIHCNFCHEECNCIYTSKDITEDFHESVVLFIRKVLKIINYKQSWQICLKCSFSIITWNNIKEFIQNGAKNDLNMDNSDKKLEKTYSNKGKSKNLPRKLAAKKNNDGTIRNSCENLRQNGEIISNKENNSDSNKDGDIFQLTLPEIIKNKFNNIATKTYANKKRKRCTISEQLAHIKTVGDITLHNYEILTPVISSNKQLMIDKPFVKLKKLEIEKYSCKDCQQYFSSQSFASLHELSHYLRLTAKTKNTCNKHAVNKKSNKSKLHVQNNILERVNNTQKGCTSIDLTGISDKNSENVNNTNLNIQNSVPQIERMYDPSNMCEIIYSDDETDTSKIDLTGDEVITIDSDDEERFSVTRGSNNIINTMQNYSSPTKNPVFLNSIKTNYQYVFKTFLVGDRVPSYQTKTPVLESILNATAKNNTQSSESQEIMPKIRVRNDLF